MQWQCEVLRKYIFSLLRINWEKFKSSLFNQCLNCSLKYKFKRQVQVSSPRPRVLQVSRQIWNQETSWINKVLQLLSKQVSSQVSVKPTPNTKDQVCIHLEVLKKASPIYYHIKSKSSYNQPTRLSQISSIVQVCLKSWDSDQSREVWVKS